MRSLKKIIILLFGLCFSREIFSQLKDVKILIPKEIGYTTYDFIQFLPGEKYFVVLANSLSVYNTETFEIIDDYELNMGAKNLSVSRNGEHILVTVNTDLFVFSFASQKLELVAKVGTADLIGDQPNAQYYSMLPINGCFFISKPGQIYVSIGSFTMIYDYQKKSLVSSHAFPSGDYVIHSVEYPKKEEIILAKISGTLNSIIKQSVTDLSKYEEIITNRTTSYKIKVRDSLLFCFNLDVVYTMNLEKNKIIHEVKAPKFDYSAYGNTNQEYYKELNKRIAITKPDTINFLPDEYIYDIDFNSKTGHAFFATMKGIKIIDFRTGKLIGHDKGITTNLKLAPSGKRMVCNGYSSYKALRVYDPEGMKLISERAAMGNIIAYTNISPGNKWLYTGCGASGFLWNLSNFTKYAEIRDISGSDSSFVSNAYFLNDTELVINSGTSVKNLNLTVYNIPRKKFTRVIKKGIYTMASGFKNGEFYYCDFENLHIIDLKTMKEEKYAGMFSLAASPQYHIVDFTDELVFIPESGKYKIVNRKNKQVEYESQSWSVNSRVSISSDSKYVITAGQIKKKKNYGGVEVEMPTNAIVRISMEQKEVVNNYAETFFPYDFKIKDGRKTIGIWYLKNEYDPNGGNEKESVYSEYNVETGEEKFSKSLVKTSEIISYYFTSDSGKYFAMINYLGNYFKIYNNRGDLVMDLSDMNFSAPKCFFVERSDLLIITSSVNSIATFVDLKNKKIMGQLANAAGDDYFMVTADMHYLGSKEFVKNIRFKYKSEMFSFDQFDAYLNQPHNVLRAFKCTDSLLIHAYEAAYLKRMKILGLKPGAKINFSVLPSIQYVVMKEEKNGKVNFSLSANKGQNDLAKLEVLNNGTSVYSENIKPGQAERFETNLSFETSSGINRFEFIIKDNSGLESPRITRFYNNTNMVKPDLYLVVIASEKFKNTDFDLAYAMKDASDVANTMANSRSFKNIYTKKLINQSFVADTVKDLKNFFAAAGVNDLVMVFYAGHGYLDSDLSYYFPTYYTDFSDPKINSVAYNSFERLFREMKPIRKLMFIDACFSGEVDTEGIKTDNNKKAKNDSSRAASSVLFSQSTALEMSKAIFSDLRHNSGVTVISSAGGTEAAYEDEKWNNGLFTYCLINGMKNLKADLNRNKKVTLNELQKYVSEEVNRLSEGKQTPTYRVENTVLDYELW